MSDVVHVESVQQHTPEFKSWIPRWANDPLSKSPAEQYRFQFVKELLESPNPYLGSYVKNSKSVLNGIVNQGTISYSLSVPSHSDLFDSEGVDTSTIDLGKTKFQIEFEYAVPHIKVHGSSVEVKSTIEFLRKAGLSPDSQINGGTYVDETWKNFSGTLAKLNLGEII